MNGLLVIMLSTSRNLDANKAVKITVIADVDFKGTPEQLKNGMVQRSIVNVTFPSGIKY